MPEASGKQRNLGAFFSMRIPRSGNAAVTQLFGSLPIIRADMVSELFTWEYDSKPNAMRQLYRSLPAEPRIEGCKGEASLSARSRAVFSSRAFF